MLRGTAEEMQVHSSLSVAGTQARSPEVAAKQRRETCVLSSPILLLIRWLSWPPNSPTVRQDRAEVAP